MKKSHSFLFIFFLSTAICFAQNNQVQHRADKFATGQVSPFLSQSTTAPFAQSAVKKGTAFKPKAFADTLYSQSFSNAWPSNYTTNNLNTPSNPNTLWRWDTSFIPFWGMFSQTIPSINSTTANDGFMVLPSDFYNTPLVLAITMNTFFTSPKISIPSSPGVFIKFEQFVRFCCNAANELVLEISTDSITWDTYDATSGLLVNALNAPLSNPVEEVILDVSASLTNQTQFWYRFRSSGNSHYFWMIDDVLFFEGPEQDLMLTDGSLNFNADNYVIAPFYKKIPLDIFPPLSFSGRISHRGWSTNTNVSLDAAVSLIGSGPVYSSSFNAGTFTQGQDTFVTTGMPRFIPQSQGEFQVNLLATGDSIDQLLGNESASFNFSVTDSVYARDDNNFDDGIGPANYENLTNTSLGGTTVGDRFGSLYVIEPSNFSKIIPKSVTFRVSGNPRNIGVQILPKIWLFNEDSTSLNSAFVGEVASSTSPYTVTANDTSTFLTLALDAGTALTAGLDSGQYVVGWEVTNLPSGTTFEVLNDRSTASLQPNASNFLWLGQEQIWRWTRDNPGIRLNIRSILVGIENTLLTDKRFDFKIYPNPTKGQFSLEIKTPKDEKYTLTVRNILGQNIYDETININRFAIKKIDLSSFDKGIYFLSLENENERFVRKIVLK